MVRKSQKNFENRQLNQRFSEPSFPNIILTGIMGCGKTTIANKLAFMLGWGFLDLDSKIEKITGLSISEVVNEKGIAGLRRQEASAIENLMSIRNHVISLGGGALIDKKNRFRIHKMGLLIWVDVSPAIIARRLIKNEHEIEKRPLISDLNSYADKDLRYQKLCDKLNDILESRLFCYKSAEIIIRDDYSTSHECARRIKNLF